MLVPFDHSPARFCPTVQLDSSCFWIFTFTPRSDEPANRNLLLLGRFPMACRVESDFCPPKFNSWRGRCPLSLNSFTNQSVSGPEFCQMLMLNVHLRKQSIEFLQFSDQHRGSFSQISPAGWSFSYAPANKSWSGPFQNLGFGAPMSRICKTFSQIASPRPFVWTHVINLSQQSNRFLYIEIIHVSDQLRSDQITIIYRVSSRMYHSSSSIYHASLII